MKTIKHDLILKKDTTFNENINVEGSIKGDFNLKVIGNIDCWNIDCRNIDCWNINCRNIDCWNIDCWNVDCLNIVYCNEISCKKEIKAKMLIKNRNELKQKVWK